MDGGVGAAIITASGSFASALLAGGVRVYMQRRKRDLLWWKIVEGAHNHAVFRADINFDRPALLLNKFHKNVKQV